MVDRDIFFLGSKYIFVQDVFCILWIPSQNGESRLLILRVSTVEDIYFVIVCIFVVLNVLQEVLRYGNEVTESKGAYWHKLGIDLLNF